MIMMRVLLLLSWLLAAAAQSYIGMYILESLEDATGTPITYPSGTYSLELFDDNKSNDATHYRMFMKVGNNLFSSGVIEEDGAADWAEPGVAQTRMYPGSALLRLEADLIDLFEKATLFSKSGRELIITGNGGTGVFKKKGKKKKNKKKRNMRQ